MPRLRLPVLAQLKVIVAAGAVPDLPVGQDDGRGDHQLRYLLELRAALVDDLTARATVPENIYSHHWSAGDLLLWDNRCVMHRARPFDDQAHRREMRRTTTLDLPLPA